MGVIFRSERTAYCLKLVPTNSYPDIRTCIGRNWTGLNLEQIRLPVSITLWHDVRPLGPGDARTMDARSQIAFFFQLATCRLPKFPSISIHLLRLKRKTPSRIPYVDSMFLRCIQIIWSIRFIIRSFKNRRRSRIREIIAFRITFHWWKNCNRLVIWRTWSISFHRECRSFIWEKRSLFIVKNRSILGILCPPRRQLTVSWVVESVYAWIVA